MFANTWFTSTNKLLFAIQQRKKNEFTTFSHAVYFSLQKILVLILKSSRPSQCCSCARQRRELNGKFTSASSIDVLQREHDSHVKITQTRAQQLNQTSCRMLLVCYAMSASLWVEEKCEEFLISCWIFSRSLQNSLHYPYTLFLIVVLVYVYFPLNSAKQWNDARIPQLRPSDSQHIIFLECSTLPQPTTVNISTILCLAWLNYY